MIFKDTMPFLMFHVHSFGVFNANTRALFFLLMLTAKFNFRLFTLLQQANEKPEWGQVQFTIGYRNQTTSKLFYWT